MGQITLSTKYDKGKEQLYVHRIVQYFAKAFDEAPMITDADGSERCSDDYKVFGFKGIPPSTVAAFLTSSLFYWYWRRHGDGFHCGYADILKCPMPTLPPEAHVRLRQVQEALAQNLAQTSKRKTIKSKQGFVTYREYYPASSKPIMDQADAVLAQAIGLSAEQADWVLNFEIKYRLGDLQEEAEA